MKKFLPLIFVLVLICSLSIGAMAQDLADSITLGLSNDVESFNPWLMAQDARQQVYYNQIYEPLARLTLDGQRDLVLAKSVEALGGGEYDIEIYDYIYDTKGNNIVASDIPFSFERCNEVGQLAWATRYLDHFEVTGDYTLKMFTKDESAVALDMLLKTVYIVSEKSYNESADQFAVDPVGTGPYALESYVPGSSVVLTARDDYWQTDESKITIASKLGSARTVTYKVITEASQLSLALEMGEVDVVAGKPGIVTADLVNFLDPARNVLPGYNATPYLDALIYHLEFNNSENSPLNDIRVRQAIAYAIDVPAIAYAVFGSDVGVCTTNSSPYYADYDPALDEASYYEYDEAKAKELLAEAGYANGLTIKMISQNTNDFSKTAQLVAAYLSAVGINCEVNNLESALFQTLRSDTTGTEWDICLNTVMGLNSTGRLGVIDKNAYSTGLNGLYLDDPVLQEKYMTANLAATYSPETVTDLLNYMTENCYLYSLFYRRGFVIAKDYVTDIALDRNIALIPGATTILAH